MAYSPLQLAVYQAAFAGGLAGMVANAGPIDPVAANYLTICNAAQAFAQQFDTTYGLTGASDQLSLSDILNLSEEFMMGRGKVSSINADYAVAVAAIIAAVQEANTVVNGQVSAALSSNKAFTARAVSTANVASLAAFSVAVNTDGVTLVQGDTVLLAAQTTATENGPWQIGVVNAGVAPLTRPGWWASGSTVKSGTEILVRSEGTKFRDTNWAAMFNVADSFTVDATGPNIFPKMMTGKVVLVAGTATITAPIRNTTGTAIQINRRVANTSAATTGGYCPTNAGADGVTSGGVGGGAGTGQFIIQACVAAGTINNVDVSTVNWTLNNQN